MTWYKIAAEKIIYIMRGISGAGKSTKARALPGVLPENIFSTDDLLAPTSEAYAKLYAEMLEKKDFTPLQNAHKENIRRATVAMRSGTSPIVIDNTSLEVWSVKAYVYAAMQYGYDVRFVDIGTGGLTAEELAKRNKHNVPQEAIQKMIEKYERDGPITIEKVLGSEVPEGKVV